MRFSYSRPRAQRLFPPMHSDQAISEVIGTGAKAETLDQLQSLRGRVRARKLHMDILAADTYASVLNNAGIGQVWFSLLFCCRSPIRARHPCTPTGRLACACVELAFMASCIHLSTLAQRFPQRLTPSTTAIPGNCRAGVGMLTGCGLSCGCCT